MQIQPYLFFEGRCQEAIDFYRQVLGAEVGMVMHFKESPDPTDAPPGAADKILHAAVRIGETVLLMSDGMCKGSPSFQGFSLSLSPANDAEAERVFTALSEGGAVRMPLTKTFFASRFGMLTDRFGVPWMLMVQG
jgi:PhnB protein